MKPAELELTDSTEWRNTSVERNLLWSSSIMTDAVYTSTTTPNPGDSFCLIPSAHLDRNRFILKVVEVVLSFIAFILEETVDSCFSCSPLYFFEFVSCTAFLFTLLLLVLLSTKLHKKIGIEDWSKVDLIYTGVIALLLFISSCVFATDRGHLVQATVAVVRKRPRTHTTLLSYLLNLPFSFLLYLLLSFPSWLTVCYQVTYSSALLLLCRPGLWLLGDCGVFR
uniref:MARVEL domain-containing protein n=1 Tax=Oreochromis niloticus TaxID=8128 RepID=A0A669BJQ4_ORENI